jgi:ABC-2 type transport system ATP-binding protein
MIQIKNLTKRYEEKIVLNNVTVEIPDGSIVGLVGINGVGKSTMLRLMAGIYEPDSGDIFFDGKSIFQDESVKRELYYVPDEPYFSFRDTPNKLIRENQFWLAISRPSSYVTFLHYLNKFNISTSKHLFTVEQII